ncbi:MAG: hypothetical protein ACLPXU_09930 [Acidimicrobiales bacterium]
MLLFAHAEEVEVAAAVAVRPLKDHPRLIAPIVAVATPQSALEVVVVTAPANTPATSLVEYGLYAVEQLLADESLMTTGDQLTLVGHVADVVRVPQQLRQF